jgi:predicted DNA-binding protein with PD1-like motif
MWNTDPIQIHTAVTWKTGHTRGGHIQDGEGKEGN